MKQILKFNDYEDCILIKSYQNCSKDVNTLNESIRLH